MSKLKSVAFAAMILVSAQAGMAHAAFGSLFKPGDILDANGNFVADKPREIEEESEEEVWDPYQELREAWFDVFVAGDITMEKYCKGPHLLEHGVECARVTNGTN